MSFSIKKITDLRKIFIVGEFSICVSGFLSIVIIVRSFNILKLMSKFFFLLRNFIFSSYFQINHHEILHLLGVGGFGLEEITLLSLWLFSSTLLISGQILNIHCSDLFSSVLFWNLSVLNIQVSVLLLLLITHLNFENWFCCTN